MKTFAARFAEETATEIDALLSDRQIFCLFWMIL